MDAEHDARAGTSGLAHEIRQPLCVIQLASDNLRNRLSGRLDEAEAAYVTARLDAIASQIDRLGRLLDERIG